MGTAAIVTRSRGASSITASGVLDTIDSAPNDPAVRLFCGRAFSGLVVPELEESHVGVTFEEILDRLLVHG